MPILVKAQQLQRQLIEDCTEIDQIRQAQQGEREALEAKHKNAREALEAKHKNARGEAQFKKEQLKLKKEQESEEEQLELESARQLQGAYERSVFANAWNWVDAYLRLEHGDAPDYYCFLRQAMLARLH